MTDGLLREVDALLEDADAELAARFPGDRDERQPVHTVYVPADRYEADTVARWADHALDVLDDCAATLDADPGVAKRVRAKLEREPIEDLRIDFEDGYGTHPDASEDAAVRAAEQPASEGGHHQRASFQAPVPGRARPRFSRSVVPA